MELNGIANIKILLDQLAENLPNNDEVLVPVAKIYQQLDLMNRYMIAHDSWVQEQLRLHSEDYHHVVTTKPPAWHEVKANPKAFPTLQEKFDGLEQKERQEVPKRDAKHQGPGSSLD